MTQRMQDLAAEIVRLQGELDREIEARRKELGWHFKKGIAEFEHGVTIQHRRLRVGVVTFLARSPILAIVTAPVIYSVFIPLFFIDAWASLYQAICFRVYRIPQVRRSKYIVIDRQRLAYLNFIEAFNCAYCGYGNGVLAYVGEIASRTEQYWCPIKHAVKIIDPHLRYYEFLEYGDADGYRSRLDQFRKQLRAETPSDENDAGAPGA
jgi:hypothetical protein